jgi:hypothetical protein
MQPSDADSKLIPWHDFPQLQVMCEHLDKMVGFEECQECNTVISCESFPDVFNAFVDAYNELATEKRKRRRIKIGI